MVPTSSAEFAVTKSPAPRRVFLLGGTGTIGRATARALTDRGHEVVCFARANAGVGGALGQAETETLLAGTQVRFGDVTDPASVARDGFRGERFDCLVSCLASRNGAPKDAWAIDYKAHADALHAARAVGITHVVLLSAICVQKPLLEFQRAKLAFETLLIGSGVTYSIVRPTAYFKSLSGQLGRLKQGKPYLLIGDGTMTACKPISDDDLARYLADCLDDPQRHNKVLPIGGPGPAITPKEQGEELFRLLGLKPRYTQVPVALLDVIVGTLSALGRFNSKLADKAEFARIGRYYATQSMLVLDPATGRYDADATPSTGQDTLFEFYARLVKGDESEERGDHAVF